MGEKKLSFLNKAMTFIGATILSFLTGCGGNSLKSPELEYSLGYTRQESQSSESNSFNTGLRNRQNIGKKRWQLDLDVVEQSDAVDDEVRASGDFYMNNKGPCGFGLGGQVGNKQNEVSAAGHFSLGSTKISGNVRDGSRTDESSVEGIDTKVENEYSSYGTTIRFKTGARTNLVAGYGHNNNDIVTQVTGIPGADTSVDSKSNVGYMLFSGRPLNEKSRLNSGYLGVLGSQIYVDDVETENLDVIGGANFRISPGFSITPNFMFGSQTGLGANFIFGPNTEHIADLYSRLREIEATAGNESEDYKNLLRRIQLETESARMHVLSLSGKKDDDDVENGEFSYQVVSRNGRFGIGARYLHVPVESANDIYRTDITLNGEYRRGNNHLSLDLLIPTDHNNLFRGNIVYIRRF